jgi:hypothetical protein
MATTARTVDDLVNVLKDRMPEPFIAYEITMPDGAVHQLAGPWRDADARRLWMFCGDDPKARFVAILPNGEEFGTMRRWEVHGRHGHFEWCLDCERPFRAQYVGQPLCAGCELVQCSSNERQE